MDFKKISELFTVAVPLLILCSCIRLITYYSNWNIPILDYLSIPEILFLFIQPAIIFLGFAGILFGIYFILLVVLMRWLPEEKNPFVAKSKKPEGPAKEPETLPEEPKAPLAKEKKKTTLIGIIVAVFTFGFMGFIFSKGIWFDYDIFPTVLLHLVIGMVAIGVIKKFTEPGHEKELPSLQTVLAGTMIMLISASFFYGRYEANSTRTAPIPHTLVLSNDTTINTDSNLIYLGKTSNYYFLFDNAASRASIIPMADVKKIEIGR
jgi:hypothetical protein